MLAATFFSCLFRYGKIVDTNRLIKLATAASLRRELFVKKHIFSYFSALKFWYNSKGIFYVKIFNIVTITLIIVVSILFMPYYAKLSKYSCGQPQETFGNIDRGYALVESGAEMASLVDESVARWRATYSDPYQAWCESKRDRLRKNIRLRVNTITEVDRNVEHYLYARWFVGDVTSEWKKVIFFPAAVSAISIYSAVKWVRGDEGSPATMAEFFHAQRGAWHGLWD